MLDKEINGTLVPNRTGSYDTTVYGGLQCDDMGLGKTIQITSVIINNPCRSTALIAPLAMIQTWADVLTRAGCSVFTVSDHSWVLYNPDAPVPRHFIKMRPAVYITNYEKLYMAPSLFRREWDRVVLDEAHKIRNGDSDVARYARKLVAPIRWAVTGTPLVNSLKDVVALLAFIGVPYSPLWRWEPRYLRCLPDILIHRSLDSLRTVIPDAPPVPVVHDLELPFTSSDEEDFYYGIQGASQSLLTRFSQELLSSSEAFKLLIRLRQISVHPQVYINAKRRESPSYSRPDWSASSTKLDAIKNIITADTPDTFHKYLIFCQFNDEMALIRDFLLRERLVVDENILFYNGSMTQHERAATLAHSKATTTTTVLLIQLQAGGVGLNLQEYDRIIFVSPWWTSALMDQAMARAVRMGQHAVVHVYHLRLAAEKYDSIDIDKAIFFKAHEKRILLSKLFQLCAK